MRQSSTSHSKKKAGRKNRSTETLIRRHSMNAIFWKAMAVAAVASVFYLGDGLHERHGVALGDLENCASAEPAASGKSKEVSWEKLAYAWPDNLFSKREISGGWLVAVERNYGSNVVFGLTFVPDPDHKWK